MQAHLLPVCMVSASQLCTSCLRTLKAGAAPDTGPTLAAPSSSASASHFSTAATARWYSFSCTHTHRCAPDATTCIVMQCQRHISSRNVCVHCSATGRCRAHGKPYGRVGVTGSSLCGDHSKQSTLDPLAKCPLLSGEQTQGSCSAMKTNLQAQ